MLKKKGLLVAAAFSAFALAFTACGDDSSSGSTAASSTPVVTEDAWYDEANGLVIYPSGIVTDVAGNTVGSFDIATGTLVIGENVSVIDINVLPVLHPENQTPESSSSNNGGENPGLSSAEQPVPGSSSSINNPTSSNGNGGNQPQPASSSSTNGTGWVVKLPTAAPVASPKPQITVDLYKQWKEAFVITLSQEKAKYPELGKEFNEVFGEYVAQGWDPARVIWQTHTDTKCWIDEAQGTPMYKRGCTVSEGIGYGMMISVLMEDWPTFDGIWIYSKAYRESPYAGHSKEEPGLMPWLTSTFNWGGYGILDESSATDADLDIATSLIIAYKKTGKTQYLDDAKKLINALWEWEINASNLLILSGDTPMWHTADPVLNLCYFSPVAIRLFAEVDPSHDWKGVLDAMYTYMKKVQDGGTGVFPDWSNTAGVAVDPKNGSAAKTYWTFNKESVRIPWRISWDYLWYKDERAAAILSTLNKFIVEKSSGDVNSIPATNYSWNLSVGADITGNTLSTQWLAAWCATGMADNTDWLSACSDRLNTVTMNTSASSYFTNILHLIYSELFNGWFANPN